MWDVDGAGIQKIADPALAAALRAKVIRLGLGLGSGLRLGLGLGLGVGVGVGVR